MDSLGEIFSARSWLFAPGDSERKMEKATASTADVVILDLEDAVAEEAKLKARSMVSAFLKAQPDRSRLWVRINPLSGPNALRCRRLRRWQLPGHVQQRSGRPPLGLVSRTRHGAHDL